MGHVKKLWITTDKNLINRFARLFVANVNVLLLVCRRAIHVFLPLESQIIAIGSLGNSSRDMVEGIKA